MSSAGSPSTITPIAELNPLKKGIPKRPRARDYEGCSSIQSYETLEKIGEGTFGVVHKARHRKTKDLVALKRILMHNEKDGFPITALREIKILKMLSHPNVIHLSDMTVERGDKVKKKRGSIFMVTPYMDHDLCGLLDNPKVEFTVPQIKCYTMQLLEGTRYLHSMHILHRDMKAANLLISNKGILQIADFGLARMFYDDPPPESNAPRREYTNMVVTRWYRPPELLLGERRYTAAIDLWGVGCILAEMYKGKPILQGQSDIDQLHRIFQLCGTPTESTMPGWTLLPGCEGIRSFKTFPRLLEQTYETHGSEMVSLLSELLNLDPKRRATASAALDHEYFHAEPLPAKPEDLPNYEASHEFDKRKHAAQRHEALPPKAPDAAGQMLEGNHNSHSMAARDSRPPTTSSNDRRHREGSNYDHEQSHRSAHSRNDRDSSRDYGTRHDERSWRDDRSRDYRSRDRNSYHNRSPQRRDYSRDARDHRPPARDYYDDRSSRRFDYNDRDDRYRRSDRDRREDRDRRDDRDRDRDEERVTREDRDPRDTSQRSHSGPLPPPRRSRSRSKD